MSDELWTMRVPVLSTGHLSKATRDRLESEGDDNPWMYCASYLDGYFISVPADDKFPEGLDVPPPDLLAIWKWARENKYDWVRLDSAGDVIEALRTFDW